MPRAALTACVVLLLSSCMQPLVVEGPLTPLASARPDLGLIGTWRAPDREEPAGYVVLQIDRVDPTIDAGAMQISAVLSDNPLGGQSPVPFHVTHHDGKAYMNFGQEESKFAIFRYVVEEDRLRVWLQPDEGEMRSAIEAGEIRGRIVAAEDERSSDTLVVESRGEEILEWLVENDARVFPPESGIAFERVEWPPPWPRVAADWLILFGAFLGGVAVASFTLLRILGARDERRRLRQAAPKKAATIRAHPRDPRPSAVSRPGRACDSNVRSRRSSTSRTFPWRKPSMRCSLWLIPAVLCCGCGGGAADEPSAPAASATQRAGAGADASADVPSKTDPQAAPPQAGQGVMVGEVTAISALVQLRLTGSDQHGPTIADAAAHPQRRVAKLGDGDVPGRSGVVRFALHSADDEPIGEPLLVDAEPSRDFIARAAFSDLQPGTEYVVKSRIGDDAKSLADGPAARFRTLPAPDVAAPVSFVVVTGMNYAKFHGDDRIDPEQHRIENNTELPAPYAGPDKHLGYPGLASILAKNPDFFVGTGDNVYYDTPEKGRAETIDAMRRKWHEQFVQPRYRDLFAAVPTYWMIDDHDYRIDDGDNTGDYLPTPEEARRTMLEQLPVAPHGDDDALTYRTHRIGRDLQIWFPENRMYRSPNAMEDGPEKSIWGETQKAWLKETLAASDATFKLLISPTPMIGPDDARKFDNHTNIGGFRHERDEFFAWLDEAGLLDGNFALVCGDRHWQYHAVWPNGLEEFSCGALVDENSRLGRPPGDPMSTDPEGKIVQKYSQNPRSGGFLLIRLEPATDDASAKLRFEFYDEHGKPLYEHERLAAGA